ncbi:hypothetical protein ACVOMV_08065 [Mesorhizobium atlanticum]
MKKLLLGVALSALMYSSAFAAKVRPFRWLFSDERRPLLMLRNGTIAQAKGMSGVELPRSRMRSSTWQERARPDQELRRFGRRRRSPGQPWSTLCWARKSVSDACRGWPRSALSRL